MTLPSKPNVKVVQQDGEEEVSYEIIAKAIVDLSEAMRKLAESRVKQNTIVVLLADMTKMGKRDIMLVLSALDRLESEYLKPAPPKPARSKVKGLP